MKHKEFSLQSAVCKYLDMQYPEILYLSTGTSLKLTMGQAVRNKLIQKNGFKVPDLLILHPNNLYHGLFLELKIESPFMKNNPLKLKSNPHIEEQSKSMQKLFDLKYCSHFAWTFEMAKNYIDIYLKQ